MNTHKYETRLDILKQAPISEDLKATQSKVTLLNSKVSQMKKLTTQPKRYPLLIAATTNLPNNTTISQTTLSDKTNTLTLFGTTGDRETLLTYRDQLEKIPGIVSVEIPLANYEKDTNIPYEIILHIK